jgi:hypothetical protein
MNGPDTFTCCICGEPSTKICVYCTCDSCVNHLCEKCDRCSDCCACDARLRSDEPGLHSAPSHFLGSSHADEPESVIVPPIKSWASIHPPPLKPTAGVPQ